MGIFIIYLAKQNKMLRVKTISMQKFSKANAFVFPRNRVFSLLGNSQIAHHTNYPKDVTVEDFVDKHPKKREAESKLSKWATTNNIDINQKELKINEDSVE